MSTLPTKSNIIKENTLKHFPLQLQKCMRTSNRMLTVVFIQTLAGGGEKDSSHSDCTKRNSNHLNLHLCMYVEDQGYLCSMQCVYVCISNSLNIKVAKCALIENTCKIYDSTYTNTNTFRTTTTQGKQTKWK